jgi:hypothetical protein
MNQRQRFIFPSKPQSSSSSGKVRNHVLASFFWVEAIVCNSDKIRLGIGDQWRLQEFFFKGVIKKL